MTFTLGHSSWLRQLHFTDHSYATPPTHSIYTYLDIDNCSKLPKWGHLRMILSKVRVSLPSEVGNARSCRNASSNHKNHIAALVTLNVFYHRFESRFLKEMRWLRWTSRSGMVSGRTKHLKTSNHNNDIAIRQIRLKITAQTYSLHRRPVPLRVSYWGKSRSGT